MPTNGFKQTVIVKNFNLYDIEIEDLGLSIGAGSEEILTDQINIYDILGSNDLYQLVQDEELVINDGNSDLTSSLARDFLTIETLRVEDSVIVSQDLPSIQMIKTEEFEHSSSWMEVSFDEVNIINNDVFEVVGYGVRVLEDGLYGISYNVTTKTKRDKTDIYFQMVNENNDILSGSEIFLDDSKNIPNNIGKFFVVDLITNNIVSLLYKDSKKCYYGANATLSIVKLQGVKGEQGIQGPQGIQGETGPPGADSNVPGPQGIQGPPGTCLNVHDGVNTFNGIYDITILGENVTITNPTSGSIVVSVENGGSSQFDMKIGNWSGTQEYDLNTTNGTHIGFGNPILVDSDAFEIDHDDRHIFVKSNGWYEVTYMIVSDEVDVYENSCIETYLKTNFNSTFDIGWASSYIYKGVHTNTATCMFHMNTNDYIEIVAKRGFGSDYYNKIYSNPENCYFIIKKLR